MCTDYSVTLSRCAEFWPRSQSQLRNMQFNRCLFFLPPLPSRTLAPLLRNMTTSNPALFATGHLDAGISAEHMLHGKQPQCSTEQDNKTQPWAKAFPPKSKCSSQPKVPSAQVQLAFFVPGGALNPPPQSPTPPPSRLVPAEYNETVWLIADSARVPWHCWPSQSTRKSKLLKEGLRDSLFISLEWTERDGQRSRLRAEVDLARLEGPPPPTWGTICQSGEPSAETWVGVCNV